jgi:hypothetical protein
MNFLNWIFQNKLVEARLSEKTEIKTNFPEADFWIIRKGSQNSVGRPTKEFNKEHIGIKVISDDLLPQYLFYKMEYVYSLGYYQNLAHGTTELKNISISDISNIII